MILSSRSNEIAKQIIKLIISNCILSKCHPYTYEIINSKTWFIQYLCLLSTFKSTHGITKKKKNFNWICVAKSMSWNVETQWNTLLTIRNSFSINSKHRDCHKNRTTERSAISSSRYYQQNKWHKIFILHISNIAE